MQPRVQSTTTTTIYLSDPWFFVKLAGMFTCIAVILGLSWFLFESMKRPLGTYLWNAFSNIFAVNQLESQSAAMGLSSLAYYFLIGVVWYILLSQYCSLLLFYEINSLNTTPAAITALATDPMYIPYLQMLKPTENDSFYYQIGPLNVPEIWKNNMAIVIEDIYLDSIAVLNCSQTMMHSLIQLDFQFGYSGSSDLPIKLQNAIRNIDKSTLNNIITTYLERDRKTLQQACSALENSFISDHRVSLNMIEIPMIIYGIFCGVALFFFILTKALAYGRWKRCLQQGHILDNEQSQFITSEEHPIPISTGISKLSTHDKILRRQLMTITEEVQQTFEDDIKGRLEEMERKVMKFYELLAKKRANNSTGKNQNY